MLTPKTDIELTNRRRGSILIAVPNDSLGGAEQYLRMIALKYLKNNYAVYILFLKRKEGRGWDSLNQYESANLIFTNSSSEKAGLFKFIRNLVLLRHINFEYIFSSHVHLTGLLGLFIRLSILKKVYFVGRESTSIFLRFKGIKLALFKSQYYLGYPALDLLICQTSFMKNQLIVAMPWIGRKINVTVMANPIDHSNMQAEFFTETRQRFFGTYIVSAGRLIPEKGFDILIRAFSVLKASYPKLKLVILGEGKDRGMLSELIKELQLEEDVILEGFVENVYTFFKHAKACVVSSRIEGFPNVLLQMMSQNEKVVSTKCAGGIEEIEGVFVSETNNVESLALTLQAVLESNTTKNRERFDAELSSRSIDMFIEKIERILKCF